MLKYAKYPKTAFFLRIFILSHIHLLLWLTLSVPTAYSQKNTIIQRGNSQHPSSFRAAKKKLKKIFASVPTTFYCDCRMTLPTVHLKGCGVLQNYSFKELQTSIEFEHIYPMGRLKERLLKKIGPEMKSACPTLSRRCLTSKISLFSHFESDMFNIRPVIKKLNRIRGTLWFALKPLSSSQAPSHKCSFRIHNKRFHVPHHIKGDVARVMFYLQKNYPSWDLFDEADQLTFKQWNQQDPLTPAEALILRDIAHLQGSTKLPFSLNVTPLRNLQDPKTKKLP